MSLGKTDRSIWPPILFLTAAMGWSLQCNLPPAHQRLVMESNGGSFFFLADGGLEVSLRVGPGKVFDWQFKNIGDRPLRLDLASIALIRQGDPIKYGLWGEPRQKTPEDPYVKLEPGGFAKYSFPVRSRSPFWPFRPESSEDYQLEFTIRWGVRDYQYRLGFEVL